MAAHPGVGWTNQNVLLHSILFTESSLVAWHPSTNDNRGLELLDGLGMIEIVNLGRSFSYLLVQTPRLVIGCFNEDIIVL